MLKWFGSIHPRLPLVLTIPHSGERIPDEAAWLKVHPESLLLTDLDRFVDQLYEPATRSLKLPALVTEVHRYAADLNRYPEDVDQDAVVGAQESAGNHPKGFHWVQTTRGDRLMAEPISLELHEQIVRSYHDTFHAEFAARLTEIRAKFPGRDIYHLDCHSMPSVGTGAHLDQGARRSDVVISDQDGRSASGEFKDAVIHAFQNQGFEVAYNWPYKGGRMTQRYGKPADGHHTIQIELNRAMYMNEATRAKSPDFEALQARLTATLNELVTSLKA